MELPSLSVRFTIFLSLLLTASTSASSSLFSCLNSTPTSSSSPSNPKATASALLSLLGSIINPLAAEELKSCFKFLVPIIPDKCENVFYRRSLNDILNNYTSQPEENALIWWPPESVLDLARLAVVSGGDPDAIRRTLDPTELPVPDVEGFAFEMELEAQFHAREYPAYRKERFPNNLGYCQKGSNLSFDDSMNLRNILWLAPMPSNSTKDWLAPGVLAVLDARPDGIIYRDLIPDYVKYVRTIYEDAFGDVVVDVNYLNIGDAVPNYQIFIC